MNKLQENKLTMYETVACVLQKHQAVVAAVAPLATATDDVFALLQQIKDKGRNKKEATAGKTQNKEQAKTALVHAVLEVASAVYSYARRTKNTEIAEITNVRESRLKSVRDTELAARTTSIHARSLEHLPNLAPFGVTAQTLTDLNAKIAAFSAALAEREAAVAERVGATARLEEMFHQMDDLLKDEVDRLVQLTRENNNVFYREYFASRVVKDLGVRREAPKPVTLLAPAPGVTTPPQSASPSAVA